jgi:hypothetical protein
MEGSIKESKSSNYEVALLSNLCLRLLSLIARILLLVDHLQLLSHICVLMLETPHFLEESLPVIL